MREWEKFEWAKETRGTHVRACARPCIEKSRAEIRRGQGKAEERTEMEASVSAFAGLD